MELASVTRLFKDQSPQKVTLLLEAVATKERFKITLPLTGQVSSPLKVTG